MFYINLQIKMVKYYNSVFYCQNALGFAFELPEFPLQLLLPGLEQLEAWAVLGFKIRNVLKAVIPAYLAVF